MASCAEMAMASAPSFSALITAVVVTAPFTALSCTEPAVAVISPFAVMPALPVSLMSPAVLETISSLARIEPSVVIVMLASAETTVAPPLSRVSVPSPA